MKRISPIFEALGVTTIVIATFSFDMPKYYSQIWFGLFLLGFSLLLLPIYAISKYYNNKQPLIFYSFGLIIITSFTLFFSFLKLINVKLNLFERGNYPSIEIFRLISFHFAFIPLINIASFFISKSLSKIYQLTQIISFKLSALILLYTSVLYFIGCEITLIINIAFFNSLIASANYIWKIGFIVSFALLFIGFLKLHKTQLTNHS